MSGLDTWKLSDEEVLALIQALDGVERTRYGQRVMNELLASAAGRQAAQAAEEGWHVSAEAPNPPDWSS